MIPSPKEQISSTIPTFDIPSSIGTDWKAVAVPRFIADYGPEDLEGSDIGCGTFVRRILHENASHVYLSDAVQAIALMSLANQTRQEWLHVEARQTYGKSVLGVARSLQTPLQAKFEALIAATYAFAFFEVQCQDCDFGQ